MKAEATYALGVATNCLATGLVSYKIWNKKETVERVFGKSGNTGYYTTVVSMLIQGGVLFTIASAGMYISYLTHIPSSVVVIGSFFEIMVCALRKPWVLRFQALMPLFQGISPILTIIYTSLRTMPEQTIPQASEHEEHPLQVVTIPPSDEDHIQDTFDQSGPSTYNSSKYTLDCELARTRTVSTVDPPPSKTRSCDNASVPVDTRIPSLPISKKRQSL